MGKELALQGVGFALFSILIAMRSLLYLLVMPWCLVQADAQPRTQAPAQTVDPLQQAMSYYRQGDFLRARENLEAMHAAHPADVQAALMLASTYIKLNRAADAAALLQPLEAGNESNERFEYVFAFALMQSGKVAEGMSRMEKLARETRNANAYVIAVQAHMARGEYHEARPDIEAALAIDPHMPGIYTMAGQVRYATDDADGAIDAYEEALRINPQDFLANLYLGTIRLNQTDIKDAQPMLELAYQLEPHAPLAKLGIVKIYMHTGKYAEAVQPLEELVKEAPDWVEARWMLADAYFKLGRIEDGKKEREAIQEIKNHMQQSTPAIPFP